MAEVELNERELEKLDELKQLRERWRKWAPKLLEEARLARERKGGRGRSRRSD